MSKHTPGPYRVFSGKGEPTPGVGPNDFGVCSTIKSGEPLSHPCRIATVHNTGTEGEAEANARLIAAAPELLAACEAMLKDIDEQGDETCWCMPDAPDSRGTQCEACQMRQAIRNARGE